MATGWRSVLLSVHCGATFVLGWRVRLSLLPPAQHSPHRTPRTEVWLFGICLVFSILRTTLATHKPIVFRSSLPSALRHFLPISPDATLSQSYSTPPYQMQCTISVSCAFSRFLRPVLLSCVVIAENISSIISRHQQRLITLACVPATSYGRAMQRFYVYRFMVHAQYVFAARCGSENVNQFTKFLQIVANTAWSVSSPRQRRCHVIRSCPTSTTTCVAAHHRLMFASTITGNAARITCRGTFPPRHPWHVADVQYSAVVVG